MAVGEAQILGQVRDALRARPGARARSARPSTSLFQQALRVGKRAHAETGIDRAAPTLVSRRARPRPLGDLDGSPASWSSAPAAMAGLAVATVVRRGRRRGRRRQPHAGARRAPRRRVRPRAGRRSGDLAAEVAPRRPRRLLHRRDRASLISRDAVAAAAAGRPLALRRPRPAARRRPGGRRPARRHPGRPWPTSPSDLQRVRGRRRGRGRPRASSPTRSRRSSSARRQAGVAPTVVALRTHGHRRRRRRAGAARAPAARPRRRRPAPSCCRPLRRVVDKLLHQPTSGSRSSASRGAVVVRRGAAPSSSPSTPRPSTR